MACVVGLAEKQLPALLCYSQSKGKDRYGLCRPDNAESWELDTWAEVLVPPNCVIRGKPHFFLHLFQLFWGAVLRTEPRAITVNYIPSPFYFFLF